MAKLRIGYSSQVKDMSHPADRRRLKFWADRRGYEITRNLDSAVDVIVLSGRADFAKTLQYKENAPVVIDLIDGYLANENPIVDLARGIGKIGVRQLSGRPRKYSSALSEAISCANATICASEEQRAPIQQFTSNCHVILDFHEEFPFIPFREKGGTFYKLLWEGQAFTASGLQSLEGVFAKLKKSAPLSLNIVTDLTTPRFLGQFGEKKTLERLGELPKILGDDFSIVPWSIPNVISNARNATISIIPLDPANALNSLKPENRLLIMWRLGLPCLTSPTLAYERVMSEAGVESICHNEVEWFNKLQELVISPTVQRNIVERGQNYIHEKHSVTDTLNRWDQAIESVL